MIFIISQKRQTFLPKVLMAGLQRFGIHYFTKKADLFTGLPFIVL